MRISIIMPNLLLPDGENPVIGGLERYAWQLVALIKELGYEVDVHQFAGADWHRQIYGTDVYGYGMASWSETAALEAMHQNTGAVLYLSIIQAPLRYKPRSVIVSHGVWWDDPAASRDYVQRSLEVCRQALTEAGHVVSCDYNFLNVVRSLYPDLADRITVIPNFVDLTQFYPSAGPKGQLRILYPRRLERCRGAEMFVQMARTLVHKGYDDLRFEMAVDRNHPDRNQALLEATRDLEAVLAVKTYPFEAMGDVYRSAQIVVFPSLCSEGTSLACLEAMACGCAVVATDVGGLTNIIINGYNGILVPPRPHELTRAVEYLVCHPHDRALLCERAKAAARAFDVEAWKRRWRGVIRTVYGSI